MPRAPRVATLIELSHRLTSGAVLVLSAALLAWAVRSYPRGHHVRRGAWATFGFMVTEALIGALLVLFALVERDASLMRAVSVSAHLVNTFFLLGSTALTAWWASGGAPVRRHALRTQAPVAWALGVPLAALLLVGATGAVTALGDTLFPSSSLAEGFAQDLSSNAHLFVRLRVIHPLLASTTAVLSLAALSVVRFLRPATATRRLANIASSLVLAQVALGIFDLVALAPVWMQLGHLVLADAVWIALVLVAAAALGESQAAEGDLAAGEAPYQTRLAGRAP